MHTAEEAPADTTLILRSPVDQIEVIGLTAKPLFMSAHVYLVASGTQLKPGHVAVNYEKQIYGVEPKAGCDQCKGTGLAWWHRKGQRVQDTCNCVLRRLGAYLQRPQPSVSAPVSTTTNATPAATALPALEQARQRLWLAWADTAKRLEPLERDVLLVRLDAEQDLARRTALQEEVATCEGALERLVAELFALTRQQTAAQMEAERLAAEALAGPRKGVYATLTAMLVERDGCVATKIDLFKQQTALLNQKHVAQTAIRELDAKLAPTDNKLKELSRAIQRIRARGDKLAAPLLRTVERLERHAE